MVFFYEFFTAFYFLIIANPLQPTISAYAPARKPRWNARKWPNLLKTKDTVEGSCSSEDEDLQLQSVTSQQVTRVALVKTPTKNDPGNEKKPKPNSPHHATDHSSRSNNNSRPGSSHAVVPASPSSAGKHAPTISSRSRNSSPGTPGQTAATGAGVERGSRVEWLVTATKLKTHHHWWLGVVKLDLWTKHPAENRSKQLQDRAVVG